jgi:hypothetical protein
MNSHQWEYVSATNPPPFRSGLCNLDSNTISSMFLRPHQIPMTLHLEVDPERFIDDAIKNRHDNVFFSMNRNYDKAWFLEGFEVPFTKVQLQTP